MRRQSVSALRRSAWLAAIVAVGAGSAAHAQLGPYRRFSQWPTDTNRNDRVVYVPLGWSFPERRPAQQPHDVSAASWYQTPLGSTGLRPDRVLDKGEYVLERFDVIRGDDATPMLQAVITRRGVGADGDVPQLHVVNTQSSITARAHPTIERVGDGIRYTFTVRPPHAGFVSTGNLPTAQRFELRFMPARDVRLPEHVTRKPTFAGPDLEGNPTIPPPRLTPTERVAGKRIEYRSGRVVETKK